MPELASKRVTVEEFLRAATMPSAKAVEPQRNKKAKANKETLQAEMRKRKNVWRLTNGDCIEGLAVHI